MRFSEAWLREWVNPPIDTQTLSAQLTMAGLEVDAVEPAAPPFSGVVVGLVLAAEPHPNAEKLRVCRVDVGQGEPLQIVCGAANVAAGMRVPAALVGAVLPGGFKIKRAKLRGVESLGMICSASELGLAETSDGILPLPADAEVGADLRTWLQLDDACIEVDLTPDRGDCLSLAGIAGRSASSTAARWRAPPSSPSPRSTMTASGCAWRPATPAPAMPAASSAGSMSGPRRPCGCANACAAPGYAAWVQWWT